MSHNESRAMLFEQPFLLITYWTTK